MDEGTYACSSALAGVQNARIKNDASDWETNVNVDGLVNWATQLPGLPEATPSFQFLHGGARNGSTSAAVVAAIDACQRLTTNFVVTLFAQDASKDIADELTDSSSTYTIDAVNDYLSSHVILMSEIEMRNNRQAFGAKQDTYAKIREAAGQIANFRFALAMQPVQGQSSSGVPTLFQPWMSSIVAAGMQSRRWLQRHREEIREHQRTGFSQWMGPDVTRRPQRCAQDRSFVHATCGHWRISSWVPDQTTYSVDNNFVYNSVQAIYISDLITLTLIDTFDRQVDGKSVAEISAQGALSILDTSMFSFKRLRWIAASDDAPKGYKNPSANLRGPALVLSAEIKLAGLVYFVPISLLVSQSNAVSLIGA